MPSTTRIVATLIVLVAAACSGDDAGVAGEGTGDTSTTRDLASSSTSSSSESSSTTADTSSGSESSSSTGEPFVPIDCTEACVDTATDGGIALCYSCRCKAAFDNWLPSSDEVQCSTASPIVTYHADVSGPQVVLEPAETDASECTNPSRLTGSCAQGSKLGGDDTLAVIAPVVGERRRGQEQSQQHERRAHHQPTSRRYCSAA